MSAFGAARGGSAGAVAFEWEGAPITGVNPGSIATDRAGRVYVPIRNQGKVNIYDNARGGNRLLASIGTGQLQDPISVVIDLRGYIYVADAATNAIVAFTPYYLGLHIPGDQRHTRAVRSASSPACASSQPTSSRASTPPRPTTAACRRSTRRAARSPVSSRSA